MVVTLQQQNCNCGIAAILEEVEKDGMVNGKTISSDLD